MKLQKKEGFLGDALWQAQASPKGSRQPLPFFNYFIFNINFLIILFLIILFFNYKFKKSSLHYIEILLVFKYEFTQIAISD